MASAIEITAGTPPEPEEGRLPWPTWVALAGLLAAEVLGLTLRFDSGNLLRSEGLTAWLLGRASAALEWAVHGASMWSLDETTWAFARNARSIRPPSKGRAGIRLAISSTQLR